MVPSSKMKVMLLLSVHTSLIAELGSRAWKFTAFGILTKTVEGLVFNFVFSLLFYIFL